MSVNGFRPDRNRPGLIYEIIPPAAHHYDERLPEYLDFLGRVTENLPVRAFNIPEVRAERERDGRRTVSYVAKAKPRRFGCDIQEVVERPAVVNRVVVHRPAAEQWRWFEETVADFEINAFILVGGESSAVDYPGPTVGEAGRALSNDIFSDSGRVVSGGITIPTRRSEESHRDEPQRLMRKNEAGLSFFSSQVLYDAGSAVRLLRDYGRLCRLSDRSPSPVYLSFAPITRAKDVKFLRWLGVYVPENVGAELDAAGSEQERFHRSLGIATRLLRTVLAAAVEMEDPVPIGLNVGHIMTYNREPSILFGRKLAEIYAEFHELEARKREA